MTSRSSRLPGASSKRPSGIGRARYRPSTAMICGSQRAEVGRVDARVRGVEQAQADALAAARRQRGVGAPVDGHEVAPATVVHQVVRRVEAIEDLAGLVEQPVVQHPDDVARVGRRRRVLDDQHAVEAPLDLLAGADVRVEPERAGVLGRELVGEGAARLDRRLRHARNAVHPVRNAHAVPVDRRRLRQVVREADAQRLAQPDAQLGPGHLAVVGPDAQLAAVNQRQLGRRAPRCRTSGRRRSATRSPGKRPAARAPAAPPALRDGSQRG